MNSPGKAIFWGGFWCGALDFTSAVTAWHWRGATIRGVGQSVASGLIGRPAAIQGGWRTASLGIFLHLWTSSDCNCLLPCQPQDATVNGTSRNPGLIYGELVLLFIK